MVVRSAYAQLRYSPPLLLATIFAMAVTYLVPPVIALFGSGVAWAMAVAAWGLMALAFQPTLRLYGRSPLWGIALPAIALGYLVFTIDSAYQYARGRGGSWKGRVQGNMQANACANLHADLQANTQASVQTRARADGSELRDRRRRRTFGQGPPGREFSGRLAADSPASSCPDPGVLRVRAHRRRHRRSSRSARAGEARAAGPARGRSFGQEQQQERQGERRGAGRATLRAQLAARHCRRGMRTIC